jgi:hypothetical protein
MPAPHRIGHTYHDFRGNKINDYALKSCIFFKDNGLWITRKKYRHKGWLKYERIKSPLLTFQRKRESNDIRMLCNSYWRMPSR